MKNKIIFFKFYFTFILFTILLGSSSCFSQINSNDTIPYLRYASLSTKFSKPIEELKKGQVISNVLKVINHDEKAISFKIDVLFPANWTSIGDATRLYTANPKDTIIVPIIILPTKLVNGNTEVLINVFLVDEDGRQIGNNFFTITTKKKVSWSIDLKNNSNYQGRLRCFTSC